MHRTMKLAAVAAIVAAAPLAAHARSSYLTTFNTKYKTANTVLDSCSTCHGSGGTSTWNPYGQELLNNIASGISSALTIAEPKDSDGDGYTNLAEINALTFPGDAKSFPAPTPAPAPKISVSPTTLALGTVTVGSTASQTTTVSNTGTGDLTVSSVARCNGTSTEFTASPSGSFVVAAGGSQTITVRYAPVDATTDSGCFQVAHNDATTSTVQVSVSGAGQAAPVAVLDVDITRFTVAKRISLTRGGLVVPKVAVVNAGTVAGTATVHVEGSVPDANGAPSVVYTASQDVTLAPAATAKVGFPVYTPAVPAGTTITWTATVTDADPDVDTATARTAIVK